MKERVLPILFLYVIVSVLGFSLILPLLPQYAKQFNASPILVGLLVASYAMAQIVSVPLIGRLSDRYGRRPLILLGAAATAVSFTILGFARSLPVLFAGRVLAGLLGGNAAIAQACIADITDEQHRAKNLGVIGAAIGIGFIFAPAIGGFLSRWGLEVPLFAAAGLSIAAFIWALAALPESLTPERRAEIAAHPKPPVTLAALLTALRRPLAGSLLSIRFVYSIAFGVFQSSFTLWASSRLSLSAQSISYVLAYAGLLSVATQGVAIGLLTRRFTERTLIIAGIALLAAALLAWGFVPNVALLLAVLVPMALAGGGLNTVLISALSKSVSHDEVGGTLGLTSSLEGVAMVVAPVVGGLLLQNVGAWSLGVPSSLLLAGLVAVAALGIRAPAPMAAGAS